MQDRVLASAGEISELVDAAAFDIEGWQPVVDRLRELIPGVTPVLLAVDPAAHAPLPVVVSGIAADKISDYIQYYAARKPWSPCLTAAQDMEILWSDDVISRDDLQKTEFYNDWLRPVGDVDAATATKIVGSNGRFAVFATHYSERHSQDQHERVAPFLKIIAPRIRRAIAAARVHVSASRKIPLLERLVGAAFVVDSRCIVQGANTAGLQLLALKQVELLAPLGCLGLADPEADLALRREVAACCGVGAPLPQPGDPGSLLNARHGIQVFALAPAAGSSASMASLFYPGREALVILRGRSTGEAMGQRAISARYRLTQAEVRLAEQLRTGRSLATVATSLGISYETARTHLRAVFAKTGTHRQAELVALLLSRKAAD